MMKGGLGDLMKQAQQMQENMKIMQEQLADVEVEGQSGAGRVKVTMTCRPVSNCLFECYAPKHHHERSNEISFQS